MKDKVKAGDLVRHRSGKEYVLSIVVEEGLWRDWVLVYVLKDSKKVQVHKSALKVINGKQGRNCYLLFN